MRRVEEIAAAPADGIDIAHGWTLHAIAPLTIEEAETALREPAAAIPAAAVSRLGSVRIFAVTYLSCGGESEFVSVEAPEGETHSSLWLDRAEGFDLFLAFRESDAHDTGFELLASIADLLVPRFSDEEFLRYARLLERELSEGATGEIDEDALAARNSNDPGYINSSLAGTLAEYIHAMWHDVEVRSGSEHLAPQFLRRRFEFLLEVFPPSPGYALFR